MSVTPTGVPTWLRRLRLVGIVLPVSAIIALQILRPFVADAAGEGLADLIIGISSVAAVVAFGITMFALLGRGYRLIESQRLELAGTNAILTDVASHEPLPAVLARIRAHVLELLDADEATITLEPGQPSTGLPTALAHQVENESPQHDQPFAPVVLRGTTIGTVRIRRSRELDGREHRLLGIAAEMVALAVAQAGVLENERHLARVDELDRIARELHDSLATVLGTLHLRLRAIPDPVEDHGAQVRDEIDALGDLCHSAYQDVREAIMGLRSLTRPEESLTQALRTYTSHYTRLGGPETLLEVEGTEPELDPAARLHLLRMIQEALTNTRKHADARRVRISLDDDDTGHHILVEDDGRGFDPGASHCGHVGYGLQTMHERSVLIGARLDVSSAPGTGTRVSIHMPQRSRVAPR
ncbi:MAG: sensor histidine kinase [Propionibacteriaceae bacterium]|nr:sensor histidine kinase [Propionibacteriaceae bacterium]